MEQERITLNDIAGYEEEKQEAKKLIDILRHFEKYRAKGASIPKGLLLCGEPGVGKTLFAKALASEAGVPLFEFESDESENEEETLKSLRSLFRKAKECVPSIIFIDELDELVSSTGSHGFRGFQSDYSRKTLKTLLTEIDGISSSSGVLVIATTNSKNTVPDALIRSGRLEKQITFRLPSIEDRAAIARLYLDRIDAKNIDEKAIASKTDSFSGADIKSLINASLIEALSKDEPLTMPIISSVIPTILFGEIKKISKTGPSECVAYHEIGHFLAQYALNGEIGSILIESYGDSAGRMVLEDSFGRPLRLRYAASADEVLDEVAVDLGGIAGEEVFLHKRFLSGKSDIQKAITRIYRVLCSGALGFEYLPSFMVERRPQSEFGTDELDNEASKGKISQKVIDILNEKLAKAIEYVKGKQELGRIIYDALMAKECLSKEELTEIVKEYEKKA